MQLLYIELVKKNLINQSIKEERNAQLHCLFTLTETKTILFYPIFFI